LHMSTNSHQRLSASYLPTLYCDAPPTDTLQTISNFATTVHVNLI